MAGIIDPSNVKGVKMISDPADNRSSESLYIEARSLEGRVLTDDQVSRLPNTSAEQSHHQEWQLRSKSYRRLLSVLKRLKPTSLLDIGCGNGWMMANLSTEFPRCRMTGVDLNLTELDQASRLLTQKNVELYYLNLMEEPFFENGTLDVIVFNASIQYFSDLTGIIERAKTLLKPKGSILINDSPFYDSTALALAAAKRSKEYYSKLGVPDMSKRYYHHTSHELLHLGLKQYFGWRYLITRLPFPLYLYTKS
ncbi:MAG: class I SAM-dependent methyltransferase [Reichenbachiella sp.]|uniref:class I SAM-dependent methyltransferase n=1 Tax=Reichenbachiella sp. TaxID=2184521 RepID=UPI0032657248